MKAAISREAKATAIKAILNSHDLKTMFSANSRIFCTRVSEVAEEELSL
jgi:hypothetical protein